MAEAPDLLPDEDLTPHFRWRWGEHGIYLGVCSLIGLFVLALHMLPTKRRWNPGNFDFIHVRYVAVADELPGDSFNADPFRDPRLIRPPERHNP